MPLDNRTLLIGGAVLLAGIAVYIYFDQGADSDDGDEPLDSAQPDGQGGLIGNAAAALAALQGAHPDVVPTSMRRDINSQASAMASNVILNSDWIKETYLSTPVSEVCQAWVDANPSAGASDIATGLTTVMQGFSDTDLAKLSYHLGGMAFDVSPSVDASVKVDIQTIVSQHNANGGKAKLLLVEGGLNKCHVQFDQSVTTTFDLGQGVA